MSTAIRVENLGKKYIIGHEKAERYTALRDVITNKVKSIFKPVGKKINTSTEEFYALKDLSFEVQQGDRVGIIGRNGAGKSTLLKLLSRITEPTSGRISIKGRVASLLEVGTGFHPELTGRENIFLNGAILGMSRVEIRKKFDEIVAFSEVEKFLDTPVKRYSSGMYVRLAFAVAAHLEPEILIVDEVLAVGDAQFQKKCLGKMEDVSNNEGRTVLFVSHNLGIIANLCNYCLVMDKGKKIGLERADKAIAIYQNLYRVEDSFTEKTFKNVKLKNIFILNEKEENVSSLIMFNDYRLILKFDATVPVKKAGLWIQIHNQYEILVSSIASVEEGLSSFDIDEQVVFDISLRNIQLFPGEYSLSVYLFSVNGPEKYFDAGKVFTFEVDSAVLNNSSRSYRSDHGIFRLAHGLVCSESKIIAKY